MFSHHRSLNSANSKLLARTNPVCTDFIIGTGSPCDDPIIIEDCAPKLPTARGARVMSCWPAGFFRKVGFAHLGRSDHRPPQKRDLFRLATEPNSQNM